jgi:hypothetical protein
MGLELDAVVVVAVFVVGVAVGELEKLRSLTT